MAQKFPLASGGESGYFSQLSPSRTLRQDETEYLPKRKKKKKKKQKQKTKTKTKKEKEKKRERETEQEKETDPPGTFAEASRRVSRSKPDVKRRNESKDPKRKKPCVE